jgi:hypothetical protein
MNWMENEIIYKWIKEKQGRRTEGEGGGGQGKRLVPVMFDVYMRRVGFSLGMLKRKRDQLESYAFNCIHANFDVYKQAYMAYQQEQQVLICQLDDGVNWITSSYTGIDTVSKSKESNIPC